MLVKFSFKKFKKKVILMINKSIRFKLPRKFSFILKSKGRVYSDDPKIFFIIYLVKRKNYFSDIDLRKFECR